MPLEGLVDGGESFWEIVYNIELSFITKTMAYGE